MHFVVYDFMLPFIVGILIQSIKLIIDFFRLQRLNWYHIFTAGGFPSFHSGITASLSTIVYLREGPQSTLFAIVIVLTFLVAYDALSVRYEAGKHAYHLNRIRFDLKDLLSDGGEFSPDLKERIGHTPIEVIGGWVFGFLVTYLLVIYLPIWFN